MTHHANLRQLIGHLEALPETDSICLPEKLVLPDAEGCFAALLHAGARFWVQPAEQAPRLGYRQWLNVGGLRRVVAGLAADCSDDELLAALTLHLGRTSLNGTSAGEAPPLVWPTFADDEERVAWWLACARAHAALWDNPAPVPASRAELDALEQRLACPLPSLLRAYHARIGALNLCETLCSVAPAQFANIEALLDAFPGITDILEDAPDAEQEWALVKEMVVFGDYLGNGNLWCFHRQTGEVWYFDHDSPPMLTRMFADVGGYLDALMFKCLLEIHDQADDERVLRQHLGDTVVEKWMY